MVNDEFYNFFKVEEGYRIQIRDDIDIDNLSIRININNIIREKEIENMYRNEKITSFEVYNSDEDISYCLRDENGLYLADQTLDMISYARAHKTYDDGYVEIPFSNFNIEHDIMFSQFENEEITKPLKELKSMIEKGKEIDGVTSISSLIEKFNVLLKKGDISIESIHIEIICHNLIRDRDNPTMRPDFTKPSINPMFISIHNSILTSNSVIAGITFERIGQQLKSPDTFDKRGCSPWDMLFISNN